MNGDPDLVRAYAATGCDESFAALVARHQGAVLTVCGCVLGNRADAEDACQKVFLVLTERIADLVGLDDIGPWLRQVARNVSRNLLRERTARARRETTSAIYRRCTMAPERPTAQRRREVLERAMARLPAESRDVLQWLYFAGLSTAAIADRLGCSRNLIAVRAHRARLRLRELLADERHGGG